ncbi:DUF4397 domain-containing protein [Pedobacter frigiditerrae]|uniref:DUF4397 domain-containing protein n=1 Tax=Pedobacter frigiditerrae TaxID=2530452 RepID=A0A4R0N1V6_9SPHI|nr:DUF4397 domain-containing protein [Pedobacter frigiditerrae]TCC93720.1 DUF4397 domain-containing protein [Pedobacter frigiditerrae]
MKLTFNYKALLAATALSLGLISCSKNDDYIPPAISGISIIHASPTTEKLDVFINNTKISVNDFSFGTKMDYLNAYSGKRKFDVAKTGTTTSLKSQEFTLEPQEGYSLFVIDKLENINLLFLKDDFTQPAAGKARIRFVNLSPDAEALNLAIAGSATDLFTNKAFKEYSTFESIDAAEKVTFNIKNKTTGANEVVLADVKIEAGKVYTLYAKGLKATADATKFGAAIFTHK